VTAPGARPAGDAAPTWGPFGVEGLAVAYHGRTVVAGVTLEVAAGTVAALVGGDGAGKTSVLRALAGAVRPAAGTVRRPDAGRIGYVSAGPGVYRDLTAAENLAFAGAAYGLRGRVLEERAGRLLDRIGLAAARDRLGGQLSGGMRQKLALAMAVLHEPELLVLDEPTTGVDPVSRAELWRLVAHAAAGGAAVVLATTYLDEAERAGSVLVLDRGRPLVAGTPEAVVAGVQGAVFEAAARPGRGVPWRRGARWRVWSPDGAAIPGARPAAVDLEDAVIVAALAARARAERDGKEAAA
jgi:ABC-2 type transport system ATP-binding protein